jgi:hypothetical protein
VGIFISCGPPQRRIAMPTRRILSLIPARRRDRLYATLRRLMMETEAVDRSLEAVGEEGIAIDETLEAMCQLFRREARRVKKSRASVAA